MTKSIERGTYIPVIEVGQLYLYRDGRGIEVNDDGDVLASHVWGTTTAINALASGTGGDSINTKTALPLASSVAWLKITYMSGGSNTTGYIPVFNSTLL